MNINYKQPQFELFPANSATLEDVNKPKFLLANLTLSLESLVIFSILGIMVALFAFSLGVERGKHLTAQSMDDRATAAWNVGNRPLAVAVPAAAVTTASVAYPAAKVLAGTPGVRLTLQLATYQNEGYARHDALELRQGGFKSFLIKSGKYWLLCVGNFTGKTSATALAKKLPVSYRNHQMVLRRF